MNFSILYKMNNIQENLKSKIIMQPFSESVAGMIGVIVLFFSFSLIPLFVLGIQICFQKDEKEYNGMKWD